MTEILSYSKNGILMLNGGILHGNIYKSLIKFISENININDIFGLDVSEKWYR